jgi:hypothetical protein
MVNDDYDYEAAAAAGVTKPDASGHWPSHFKKDHHPNRFIPSELGVYDSKHDRIVPQEEFTRMATSEQLATFKQHDVLPRTEVQGYLDSANAESRRMTKTPQEIVQDHAFLELPEMEQDKVLSTVDAHFRGLPAEERTRVLLGLKIGRPALEQAKPTTGQELSETPEASKSDLFMASAKRSTQLVGGSLAQGLAMLLGAPSDLADLAVNGLIKFAKAQAMNPDVGFQDVDLPLGGEDLNAMLPEAMKPPKDMSGLERIASRGIQEVGAAAIPIAASLKLLKFADPRKLVAIETALASSAGVTAQTLKELLPNSGPLMEFTGELIGSFGPTGALKLLRKAREGVVSATGLRSEKDIERAIGEQFNKVSSPEDVRAGVEAAEGLEREMPGFKPTTGQVSGSPGLIQAERVYQRSSGEATNKGKVTLQQNQEVVGKFLRGQAPEGKLEDTVSAIEATKSRETAMLDAGLIRAQAEVDLAKRNVSATTERLIQQADERAIRAEANAQAKVNALQGRLTPDEAGQILRREYQSELQTFRESAAAKYADIDPTGEVHLPLDPLKRASREVRAEFDPRVESGQRVPVALLDRIDALGMNWEMRARAEKALADLDAVGGKGLDARGGIRSNYPAWYRELATGNNPLDRGTIEQALDTIRTGAPHGLEAKTIAHVEQAIRNESGFRGSPFFHPGMDIVGKDSENFSTLKRLESELHTQIREANATLNDPLSRRLNRLLDGVKDTMNQLDGATEIQSVFPGIADKYHEANEFYAKGVQRLKAGEAAALRHKDKWGRFRTQDEDAAGLFMEGHTSVNDFVQAIGTRSEARDALRDYAKGELYRVAVYPDMHPKAGQINLAAAAHWVQRHDDVLRQFPDVREQIDHATKWQATATALRTEAEAILKKPEAVAKIKNPRIFGDLNEVERRHAAILNAREQTLGAWQKSVASEFLGLDADRAAQVVVRNARPNTIIADVAKRIGSEPDGQAGFTRALWDAALDRFSVDILDAGGNRALQAKKIEKFLAQNESWMTERFGAARIDSMRKSAEAMRMLESTGKPVLSGGSDTFTNLSHVLTDWGPFLSRLYAERSGRASMQWLISERTARVLGKVMKSRTEEGAMELLDRAFYDPKVAETMMLAAKNASEPLLEKRFRFHLGTPYGAPLPGEAVNE